MKKLSTTIAKEDGTPKQILNKTFKFIKNRKIYYIISTAIIIGNVSIIGHTYRTSTTGPRNMVAIYMIGSRITNNFFLFRLYRHNIAVSNNVQQ